MLMKCFKLFQDLPHPLPLPLLLSRTLLGKPVIASLLETLQSSSLISSPLHPPSSTPRGGGVDFLSWQGWEWALFFNLDSPKHSIYASIFHIPLGTQALKSKKQEKYGIFSFPYLIISLIICLGETPGKQNEWMNEWVNEWKKESK